MRLLIRWVITAVALFAADYFLEGISVPVANRWQVYAVMAIIFTLVNGLVGPILKLLSLPLIFITLGLFALVVNAITFWLSSYVAMNFFHVDFIVNGFMSAFLGSLIVSLVSTILNMMFLDNDRG